MSTKTKETLEIKQHDTQLTDNKKQKIIGIASFLFVIFLTVFLVLVRDQIQHLESLGYPGIFIISLLTHATLIVPMPTIILASALGAIFDPFWVAILAGSGAAFGELTGFIAGAGGSSVIKKNKWYDLTNNMITGKMGGPAILLLAFIPNPLFDLAGMIAGISKMSVTRFLFWCWIGKVLKMFVFTYGGNFLINQHS